MMGNFSRERRLRLDVETYRELAWRGLVPGQYSTGDKTQLGSIGKRGNRYLRRMLVRSAYKDQHARIIVPFVRLRRHLRRAQAGLQSKRSNGSGTKKAWEQPIVFRSSERDKKMLVCLIL